MVGSIRAGKALMKSLPAGGRGAGEWLLARAAHRGVRSATDAELGPRRAGRDRHDPDAAFIQWRLDILRDVGPDGGCRCEQARPTCATELRGGAQSDWATPGFLYLDCGPCRPAPPSTVVDLTDAPPQLLREGELSVNALQTVAPSLLPIARGRMTRPSADPGRDPFSVLHVCTGNIGRSPMAQYLMQASVSERLGERAKQFCVSSAGTWGLEGSGMERFALLALQRTGTTR